MAELDLKFYENTDTYSDGDIENTLLELAENGFDITKSDKVYPFAVAYHFSPERENILNWYPFKKTDVCLEIGAGCGAITGMLCEKCASVVSVDISKRRSKINYARHKDIDNLTIYAGNIQKMEFTEKFDAVVLNGVFEYALSFIHTDTPYITLLGLAKSFLKPSGRLFIAIENRIGLKYLNGAAEDHTDNYFLGMNDYAGNDSVRTFTKEEITELANAVGFTAQRFYYPYPDYKFPSEIFTDSTVNHGFGTPYMNLNSRSFGLYSEQRMSASLCKEGIMGHFANSFLVELAFESCDTTVDYVKINSLRKPEFRIMTILGRDNEKFALKLPACKEAKAHIEKMNVEKNIYPNGISFLKAQNYKNGLKYPFLTQKNLVDIISESTEELPVSSELKKFFSKFKTENAVYDTDEFKNVFGDAKSEVCECIRPANIDLICDNIFYENGSYTIIDNEWCFDMYVPIRFIIWRCINELYYKNPSFEEKESRDDVMSTFGIDTALSDTFMKWAVYFADKYVGMNYLSAYTKPLNQLSFLDIFNDMSIKRSINTACYYDKGNGYTEEEKIYTDIVLDDDGGFEVTFPLPEKTASVRWDIAEGRLLKCRIDSIENVGTAVFSPDNAKKSKDGFDIFYTIDPHYTITGLSGSEFTIKGHIKNFTAFEAYAAAGEKDIEFENSLNEKEFKINEQNKILSEKEISQKLDAKYIKSCESRIKAYFAKLNQKESELAAKDAEIDALSAQIEYYRNENIRIQNSLGWRFMSVFWRLKAKLTHRGK